MYSLRGRVGLAEGAHSYTSWNSPRASYTRQFSGGPWSSQTQDWDPDIHATCDSHNGRGNLREKKLEPGPWEGHSLGNKSLREGDLASILERCLSQNHNKSCTSLSLTPILHPSSSSEKRTFQNVPLNKPDCTRNPVWALKSALKTTLRSRKAKTRATKQKLPSKHSKGN